MKKVLFATTAASALLLGGIASAQGIALFGDARLGLGYNINNDGALTLETNPNSSNFGDPTDDLRAVSRVRFGVNMTGETDSGITFGATIRADNAVGGKGGATNNGQTDGSVFVSGSWGTLTFGDTNGADEQWVGDVPGDYSLTGMGNFDETPFVSNGGGYGNSDAIQFANNPNARPTVRYDFDIAGFGISLSSNRDLTDIVVGAGYSADFGGGNFSIGAGYNKFDDFDTTATGGATTVTVIDTATGNPVTIVVPGAVITNTINSGEQWSVGLKGTYDKFGFGATWSKIDLDDSNDPGVIGGGGAQSLLFGASAGFDAFSVGAYYQEVLNADGDVFEDADGNKSYGLTGQYDLGGGATVNAGIANVDGFSGLADGESAVVGDFGISMAF
jgi:outer membrane protein OmpU